MQRRSRTHYNQSVRGAKYLYPSFPSLAGLRPSITRKTRSSNLAYQRPINMTNEVTLERALLSTPLGGLRPSVSPPLLPPSEVFGLRTNLPQRPQEWDQRMHQKTSCAQRVIGTGHSFPASDEYLKSLGSFKVFLTLSSPVCQIVRLKSVQGHTGLGHHFSSPERQSTQVSQN